MIVASIVLRNSLYIVFKGVGQKTNVSALY